MRFRVVDLDVHVTWEELQALSDSRDPNGTLHWDSNEPLMATIFDQETIVAIQRHLAAGGSLPQLVPHKNVPERRILP